MNFDQCVHCSLNAFRVKSSSHIQRCHSNCVESFENLNFALFVQGLFVKTAIESAVAHLAMVEVLRYRSTREHKMSTANNSHKQSYTACTAKEIQR